MWKCWLTYASLYKALSNYFPKQLYNFAFPPPVYESSSYLAFYPRLAIIRFLFDFNFFSQFHRYTYNISYCGFNLHFLMTNNIEHFSCDYLPVMLSLVTFLFNLSPPYVRLFVFLLLRFKSRNIYILTTLL